MKDIQASDTLQLQVLVSGTHLSPEFGDTWRQIIEDGFPIDAKVEMLLSSDSSVGVAKSMGLGAIGFAEALERLAPDVLVVLGDRFEALAVVQVAAVLRIPVAHLHGGEITEGATMMHSVTPSLNSPICTSLPQSPIDSESFSLVRVRRGPSMSVQWGSIIYSALR